MLTTEYHFRPMEPSDWPAVARVYGEGIRTGNATFESDVPEWSDWHRAHLERCRLVVELEGKVVAWAALLHTSMREVYRGVAEASIYVGEGAQGQGIGTKLLTKLIECSENHGFWTLQASIFPENERSVRLHQRHGFRIVGTRERMGAADGRWRDVLLLERRSSIVGT